MTQDLSWAVRFQNVTKRFEMQNGRPQSILETLTSAFSRQRRSEKQTLVALEDISFDVPRGQTVGFVGTNGSGKSTMLKLAARIIRPTSGLIEINGRVSALLELGTGFHSDLTGRENIFLNGALMGLEKEFIEEHYTEIVDFSELGNYIDVPVKFYSSGMYMRLAFSLAIHVMPDILFIDEILAVGDQAFQNKCYDRLHRLQKTAMTILIVSHDLRSMQNLCDRMLWINQGHLVADGEPKQVLADYLAFTRKIEEDRIRQATQIESAQSFGSGDIEIEQVQLLDEKEQPTTMFKSDDAAVIEISYSTKRPITAPQFNISIYRQDGVQINSPNSETGGLHLNEVSGSGIIAYSIERLNLLPGNYYLTIGIQDQSGLQTYDFREKIAAFRVIFTDKPETHGILSLPASWEHRTSSEDAHTTS